MKNLENENIKKYLCGSIQYQFGNDYLIPIKRDGKILRQLFVIVAKENEWEHASVSVRNADGLEQVERCPKWDEMKMVKEMFWNDEELVVQVHPKKSEYVNVHEHVLHLWRKDTKEFELVFDDL